VINKEEIFKRLVYDTISYEEESPCTTFGIECPHYKFKGDCECNCDCDYDRNECYKNLKKVLTSD
jgi:hypothetical protein